MIGNIHNSLRQQITVLNRIMERKAAEIESGIDNRALTSLERSIQLESFINLTNYSATNSAPRDSRVRQAFEILADLVGFEYNDKGSFISTEANDAFKRDVTVNHGKLSLKYTIEGKLKELEDGRTNWKNLKRFFGAYSIKTKIKEKYPTEWKSIYERMNSLFQTSKDPTMPEGRPYISHALKEGTEYLHLYIKDIVHRSFDSKGRWRDILGRYA